MNISGYNLTSVIATIKEAELFYEDPCEEDFATVEYELFSGSGCIVSCDSVYIRGITPTFVNIELYMTNSDGCKSRAASVPVDTSGMSDEEFMKRAAYIAAAMVEQF